MEMDTDPNDMIYNIPDNLTEDQLVQILTRRLVLCNNTDHCPLQKEKLVELFKKFIMPLPQRAQNKRMENKRKPREMLKYIRFISSKERRKPVVINDTHLNENGKKSNDVCRKQDDMNKAPTSIVRITTKYNEKQRKPVKLKRKRPKSKDEEILNKKQKDQICNESKGKAETQN